MGPLTLLVTVQGGMVTLGRDVYLFPRDLVLTPSSWELVGCRVRKSEVYPGLEERIPKPLRSF